MESVSFRSSGKNLSGTLFHPAKVEQNNPAILFIIGWTSRQERYTQYAKALTELGYICMTFDLAGHGTSEGDINKISRKEFLQNCIDAYDYLKDVDGVDSEKISVVGSSFGGYLVTILSSKRDVQNLVLNVVQNYPDEKFEEPKVDFQGKMLKEWRKKKKDSDETMSLRALNSFERNVLIVQSEFDEYVTDQTTKNYINAVQNKDKLTHVFLDGAPHSLKKEEDRSRYENILIDWFSDKV